MSAMKSGVRPAVAGGVLAVLFVASIGVSAAAAIATSPDGVPAAASSTSPEPGASSSTAPEAEPGPASQKPSSGGREVTPVTTAPTKATKSQVKKSEAALCNADPQDLPKLDFQSGTVQWIKTLEVLAADRGFKPGAIDGIYNIQTRNAIRSFEEILGVVVDGVMDSSTWQALWDDLCAPDPVFVPTEPVYTPPSGGGGGGGSSDDGGLSRLD